VVVADHKKVEEGLLGDAEVRKSPVKKGCMVWMRPGNLVAVRGMYISKDYRAQMLTMTGGKEGPFTVGGIWEMLGRRAGEFYLDLAGMGEKALPAYAFDYIDIALFD
jgi:hypothetical protein